MVKGRVWSLKALLVTTHWTNCWSSSLDGTPISEPKVVTVPLWCSIASLVAMRFPGKLPKSQDTVAGGLEPAAVQVARETSLSPKTGWLSTRLETGGTRRITVDTNVEQVTSETDFHSGSFHTCTLFLKSCTRSSFTTLYSDYVTHHYDNWEGTLELTLNCSKLVHSFRIFWWSWSWSKHSSKHSLECTCERGFRHTNIHTNNI